MWIWFGSKNCIRHYSCRYNWSKHLKSQPWKDSDVFSEHCLLRQIGCCVTSHARTQVLGDPLLHEALLKKYDISEKQDSNSAVSRTATTTLNVIFVRLKMEAIQCWHYESQQRQPREINFRHCWNDKFWWSNIGSHWTGFFKGIVGQFMAWSTFRGEWS